MHKLRKHNHHCLHDNASVRGDHVASSARAVRLTSLLTSPFAVRVKSGPCANSTGSNTFSLEKQSCWFCANSSSAVLSLLILIFNVGEDFKSLLVSHYRKTMRFPQISSILTFHKHLSAIDTAAVQQHGRDSTLIALQHWSSSPKKTTHATPRSCVKLRLKSYHKNHSILSFQGKNPHWNFTLISSLQGVSALAVIHTSK